MGARNIAVYTMKTITGSCQAASTDARVYVELFGERSPQSTGQQRLYDQKPGNFAAGCTDTFEVRCADVGKPKEVVVFHDNSGARPQWFLEAIHIAYRKAGGPPGRWIHFPCGQWLGVEQGDGRIIRRLSPRVIRVQHYDGMHDAAAQQLTLTSQDTQDPEYGEVGQGNQQTLGAKSQIVKAADSSGNSCRSTKIRAARHALPQSMQPNMDVWPGPDMKEQPGKADIMHRYLQDGYRADC